MKTKQMTIAVTGFKALDSNKMEFECYGNTTGNIDHAYDRTLPGAYQKSIAEHKAAGTMPKMFWMHDPYQPPLGVWVDMEEDSHGLKMKGRFANTERGREIYELMKTGALDSFSIGYIVIDERWNSDKGCNDLIEIQVKEVSVVTFACNEESLLTDIKSKLEDGELPTKRELQDILRKTGLSKRQAERITNKYKPEEPEDGLETLAKYLTENNLKINM